MAFDASPSFKQANDITDFHGKADAPPAMRCHEFRGRAPRFQGPRSLAQSAGVRLVEEIVPETGSNED
jgi:hypothetical protein